MPLFSSGDLEKLAGPHVGRAWFVHLMLTNTSPATDLRLHNGVGVANIGGFEWRGVTDPFGGRLVAIGDVEDPQFGQAPQVSIVLSGVDLDFVRSIHLSARDLEGADCDIYWSMVDPETGEVLIALKRLFPGTLSSPSVIREGVGRRGVSFTVESIWASKNYAPGGKWNGANQRRRFAGDLGLDYMGVAVADNWR